MGTGSGAIALSLAAELPGATVTATDVSADALALARENAAALGLAVDFRQTSLLDGLAGPFDLVVSNPPYVLDGELDGLEPEVRDWEPRLALVDDGPDRGARRATRAACSTAGSCSRCTRTVPRRSPSSWTGSGTPTWRSRSTWRGRERVVEGRWRPST